MYTNRKLKSRANPEKLGYRKEEYFSKLSLTFAIFDFAVQTKLDCEMLGHDYRWNNATQCTIKNQVPGTEERVVAVGEKCSQHQIAV